MVNLKVKKLILYGVLHISVKVGEQTLTIVDKYGHKGKEK